jgi:thymidylate kinase
MDKDRTRSPEMGNKFLVIPNMISIDAPDGSGKSTLSKTLVSYVKSELGFINIQLVRPTYWDQSPGAQIVEKKFKSATDIVPNSLRHNRYFMEAMAKNYSDTVIPALEKGNIVVLDSSEIRSVAYMLDKGDNLAIDDTLQLVKSGYVTSGILSGVRIILKTNPEECLLNLFQKGKMDEGDPRNITEAIRRHDCYQEAISHFKGIQNNGTIWMEIDNPRCGNGNVTEQLYDMIEQTLKPVLVEIVRLSPLVK